MERPAAPTGRRAKQFNAAGAFDELFGTPSSEPPSEDFADSGVDLEEPGRHSRPSDGIGAGDLPPGPISPNAPDIAVPVEPFAPRFQRPTRSGQDALAPGRADEPFGDQPPLFAGPIGAGANGLRGPGPGLTDLARPGSPAPGGGPVPTFRIPPGPARPRSAPPGPGGSAYRPAGFGPAGFVPRGGPVPAGGTAADSYVQEPVDRLAADGLLGTADVDRDRHGAESLSIGLGSALTAAPVRPVVRPDASGEETRDGAPASAPREGVRSGSNSPVPPPRRDTEDADQGEVTPRQWSMAPVGESATTALTSDAPRRSAVRAAAATRTAAADATALTESPSAPGDTEDADDLQAPEAAPAPSRRARSAATETDADEAGSTRGGAPTRTRSGRRRRQTFWRELPMLIVVALVLTVVIQTFLARPYEIPSGSMEQTLHGCTGCTDDRVLVDKLTFRFTSPTPGDVVVFKGPPSWVEGEGLAAPSTNVLVRGLQTVGSLFGLTPPDEEDLIKRVIAVGGQTVACCDAQNRVTVDGRPLNEPYLYFLPEAGPPTQTEFGPVKVPEGDIWAMGDSRNNSADSRVPGHGPVPVDNVIGKARWVILPFSRIKSIDDSNPQQVALSAPSRTPVGPPLAFGLIGALPITAARRWLRGRRSGREADTRPTG